MTNADADYQVMVTDQSQNPRAKINFSGDIVGVTYDSAGQTSLNVTPYKQTPDMVRTSVLG